MHNQVSYVFNGESIRVEKGDHTPIIPAKGDCIQTDGLNYTVSNIIHKFGTDCNNEIFLHRVIVILNNPFHSEYLVNGE